MNKILTIEIFLVHKVVMGKDFSLLIQIFTDIVINFMNKMIIFKIKNPTHLNILRLLKR